MTAPAKSWAAWIRWRRAVVGVDVGVIERLPRAIAEVFIERGDAEEVDPETLPADVRRRGGTAA